MMRLVVLSLLATTIVPFAAAECVADVCVTPYSYGDGCTSGADWDDTARGVNVDAAGWHAYVTNGCYVFNSEGYSEEGSNLAVGAYACCDNGFQVVAFSWYGYTWNGNEECSYVLYSYGMDPLPNGPLVDPVPCVDGAPGVILP